MIKSRSNFSLELGYEIYIVQHVFAMTINFAEISWLKCTHKTNLYFMQMFNGSSYLFQDFIYLFKNKDKIAPHRSEVLLFTEQNFTGF